MIWSLCCKLLPKSLSGDTEGNDCETEQLQLEDDGARVATTGEESYQEDDREALSTPESEAEGFSHIYLQISFSINFYTYISKYIYT